MKRNLALASGIAVLAAMFCVPSNATALKNAGWSNGTKINGENLNGENLNGAQSGQALQGLPLNQVTVSLPR